MDDLLLLGWFGGLPDCLFVVIGFGFDCLIVWVVCLIDYCLVRTLQSVVLLF